MRGILRMIPASYGVATPLTDAWIVATGESDVTKLNAYRNWEQYIIVNNIRSKYKHVKILCAGNSTKASLNFIDTTTQSSINYGGLTFTDSGVVGNGSTGYIDSGMPQNSLLPNNAHQGMYCRTNDLTGVKTMFSQRDIGGCFMHTDGTTMVTSVNNNSPDHNYNLTTISDSLGLHTANRTGNTNDEYWKRGSKLNAGTFNGGNTTNSNTTKLFNFIGYNRWDTRQFTFYTAGDSFNTAEMSFHYAGIQQLMTDLSLQV